MTRRMCFRALVGWLGFRFLPRRCRGVLITPPQVSTPSLSQEQKVINREAVRSVAAALSKTKFAALDPSIWHHITIWNQRGRIEFWTRPDGVKEMG